MLAPGLARIKRWRKPPALPAPTAPRARACGGRAQCVPVEGAGGRGTQIAAPGGGVWVTAHALGAAPGRAEPWVGGWRARKRGGVLCPSPLAGVESERARACAPLLISSRARRPRVFQAQTSQTTLWECPGLHLAPGCLETWVGRAGPALGRAGRYLQGEGWGRTPSPTHSPLPSPPLSFSLRPNTASYLPPFLPFPPAHPPTHHAHLPHPRPPGPGRRRVRQQEPGRRAGRLHRRARGRGGAAAGRRPARRRAGECF